MYRQKPHRHRQVQLLMKRLFRLLLQAWPFHSNNGSLHWQSVRALGRWLDCAGICCDRPIDLSKFEHGAQSAGHTGTTAFIARRASRPACLQYTFEDRCMFSLYGPLYPLDPANGCYNWKSDGPDDWQQYSNVRVSCTSCTCVCCCVLTVCIACAFSAFDLYNV